jgi:multicomponent Na+:H+ antiporter subunit B
MSKSHSGDSSLLSLWVSGDLDLTEQLERQREEEPEEEKKGKASERYRPRRHAETFEREIRRSAKLYAIVGSILCVIFGALMLLTVANLPPYGNAGNPTVNEVAGRYVESGTEETGAVNTVAGMILDYRAFDTLGESFVLFTAMCAVTLLMNQTGRRRTIRPQREAVHYANDPVVRTMCAFVIPIIMVFGIYILLNGHLSPGGGFSGGAILAAGLIVYAIVWGDERASALMTPRLIRTVVLCALGFYALSKTYSFYTGANHLHSVITPGTPGRILSAGLILPLNVAVGLVVCCTMYSFFMYFRRGKL